MNGYMVDHGNDNSYSFELINYNRHKNLMLNGMWHSVYQHVYLSDGTNYSKYII